ncbi:MULTISPECIES: 2-hydroxyacid dehydrogenase [Amycolatopsis]|uniref:Glyoxylate reductase n=1 Tax=Amycolatopsis japonica TaxID=208439 RepID=A0A075UKS3_9PSEU|nr:MULTISPECIES: D-glycerate dehydrogenase [Amycolatopsis]AIG74757.1 Glyoxylate reductase [Amycolatopsis japonica]OKJ89985.1 glyoxylate reductase [Amycolatopsis sp. CB00013]
MTSTIAVTRWIPDEALKVLAEAGEVKLSRADRPLTPDELREFVRGSSAIVGMLHDRIDGEVADAAGPDLKVVANVAVGYDNIDVPALAGRGITVTNTPGVLTDATADLAFGLILAVTRRLGEGERLIRSRTPWSFHLGFLLGSSLQDKTLGIVGLGQIGQAVARRALGFGMRIVYSGRSRAAEDVEKTLGAKYVPFDELLRSSDVVSLHCPLTPETRHLVDADALKAMKPGAYLINTTRGPVVHEAALADALEAGEIAGAGLDVFEAEPEVEPRLLDRENVVLTPHLGSATVETRTAMAVLAAENVASVLTGGNPLTEVRP